jgi:c-di-GMP-related signal transduction protein
LEANAVIQNPLAHVARQPILDRRGAVVGHELFFRDPPGTTSNLGGFARTSAVIERVIGTPGFASMLDSRDVFLNCPDAFLFSDLVHILPPEQFVLEVLEDSELSSELRTRCDTLRREGFRIALDDVCALTPEILAFLPHVDIVKLDWPYIESDQIPAMVATLKQSRIRILAEKLETRSAHDTAMQLGCNLFQGYFFAKPLTLAATQVSPELAGVIRVLELVMANAHRDDIVAALRNAPTLVVQLLRLVNAAGCLRTQRTPITSLSDAVTQAGTRQLTRWCCLLFYGTPSSLSPNVDPLVELAQNRAAFMEQTARDLVPGDDELAEQAYLSGLLSLAHVPHGVDVKSFIGALPLSVPIQRALIEHADNLGHLLLIAELQEQATSAPFRHELQTSTPSSDETGAMPSAPRPHESA